MPGRGCRKTLKKLFYEAGIPPEDRDRIAVLSDDAGAVWAAGFGCDARVLPDGPDGRLLCLAFFDENGRPFPFRDGGKRPAQKRNEQE